MVQTTTFIEATNYRSNHLNNWNGPRRSIMQLQIIGTEIWHWIHRLWINYFVN
jgi:hypothetical protein